MTVPDKIFTPYSEAVNPGKDAQRLAGQMDFLACTFPLLLFLKLLGPANREYFLYASRSGWLVYEHNFAAVLFVAVDLLAIVV